MNPSLKTQALAAATAFGIVAIAGLAFVFMPTLRTPSPADFLPTEFTAAYVEGLGIKEGEQLAAIFPELHNREQSALAHAFIEENGDVRGVVRFSADAQAEHGLRIEAEPPVLTGVTRLSGAVLTDDALFAAMRRFRLGDSFVFIRRPMSLLHVPSPFSRVPAPIGLSISGSHLNILWEAPHTKSPVRGAAFTLPADTEEVLRLESMNLFYAVQSLASTWQEPIQLGAMGLLQQLSTDAFGLSPETSVSLVSLLNAPGTLSVRKSGSSSAFLVAGTKQSASTYIETIAAHMESSSLSIERINRVFDDSFTFDSLKAERGSNTEKETRNGWTLYRILQPDAHTMLLAYKEDLFLLGTDEKRIRAVIEEEPRMPTHKNGIASGFIHTQLLEEYEWIDTSVLKKLLPEQSSIKWDMSREGSVYVLEIRGARNEE